MGREALRLLGNCIQTILERENTRPGETKKGWVSGTISARESSPEKHGLAGVLTIMFLVA